MTMTMTVNVNVNAAQRRRPGFHLHLLGLRPLTTALLAAGLASPAAALDYV